MDTNLTKISVKGLKEQLKLMWQLKETILITGPVGIGKTTIITDFARDNNLNLLVFILAQVDALDLRGIPAIKDDSVQWCPPSSLPLQENKNLASLNTKKFLLERIKSTNNEIVKSLLLKAYEQLEPVSTLKVTSSKVLIELLEQVKTKDLELYLDLNSNKSIQNLIGFNDESKGILFFDELFNASYDTQAAIQQLLQERRIGEYELLPGWVVWAAANLLEHDVPNTHQNSAAIKDRVTHYSLECRASSLIQYAEDNNWHPAIISFLKVNPNHIHGKEEGYPHNVSDSNCFPTPRSWEKVSQFLYSSNGDINNCYKSVEGRIGSFSAEALKTHITKIYGLPPLEKFLSGNEKQVTKLLCDIKDLGTLYYLLYKVQYTIDDIESLKKALLLPIICYEQANAGNTNIHQRAIEVGSMYAALYMRKACNDPNFNFYDKSKPDEKESRANLITFYGKDPIGQRVTAIIKDKGSLDFNSIK